jgi:hypothetical protein
MRLRYSLILPLHLHSHQVCLDTYADFLPTHYSRGRARDCDVAVSTAHEQSA